MRSILCPTKGLPVSPRFSPILLIPSFIFYGDTNSAFLSTPLYSSRLYAQNPVFEIARQESVKVYDTYSCEKQSMIDGCNCAARVTAYSSIFEYPRAAVYNLYNSSIVPTSWRVRSVCGVYVLAAWLPPCS